MKKTLWLLLFLSLCFLWNPLQGRDNELSSSAKMSMLTASPGSELYSVFGHSALRVWDPLTGIDEVYNYGTFDFETPFFYYKFVRGQLLYRLSVTTFDRFLWEYHQEGRAMYEQVLNLTPEEMHRIYEFLLINRLPENREYAYDFFYDNCSTRIRDLIDELLGPDWGFDPYPLEEPTFREMLKPYLSPLPWSRFGVDIALGLPADRIASPWHKMFLPDHMFNAFSQARLQDGRQLVEEVEIVLEPRIVLQPMGVTIPLITCWFILILGLASLWRIKWSLVFDRLFFTVLGITGLVVFLLWFFSEHHATNYNMNLLWALPTHLYFIFQVGKANTSTLSRLYFKVIAAISILLLLFWYWLPQDFHPAFFPLVMLVAIKALTYGFNIKRLIPPAS